MATCPDGASPASSHGVKLVVVAWAMAAAHAANGQQLLHGVTHAQCNALGGRILSYTNTAGVGPDVGECFVPPRAGAGGIPSPAGRGDLGAAFGNLGSALGAFGDLLNRPQGGGAPARPSDAARQEDTARRNEEAARHARQAQCHANFAAATSEYELANDLARRSIFGDAIPRYEHAIALLGECGDSRNIAVVRENLAIASQRHAAVQPDDRVAEARLRFGTDDPYAGPNPFAASLPREKVASQRAGGPAAARSCASFGGVMREGKCWLIAVTREECRDILHGSIAHDYEDGSGNGYQYCGFDAAAVALQEGNPQLARAHKSLRDRLAERLRKLAAAQPARGERPGVAATTTGPATGSDSNPASSPAPSGQDAVLRPYLDSRDPSTGGTRGGNLGGPKPGFTNIPPLPAFDKD